MEVQDEAKPSQVCFWGNLQEVPRFYGLQPRNRSQFREDQDCTGDAPHKESHCPKPACFKISQAVLALLPSPEATEEFLVVRGMPRDFCRPQDLSFTPLLDKPDPDKKLYLYLVVSSIAISAVVVHE